MGEVGGCLTGKHGVRIASSDPTKVQDTRAALEAQMRIKDVFGPAWMLHPARVLPRLGSVVRLPRATLVVRELARALKDEESAPTSKEPAAQKGVGICSPPEPSGAIS